MELQPSLFALTVVHIHMSLLTIQLKYIHTNMLATCNGSEITYVIFTEDLVMYSQKWSFILIIY